MKNKGTYFEGDFSALSQWLGTDLDFNKIQNMLLGNWMICLRENTKNHWEQLYRLDDLANNNTKKNSISTQNFSIQNKNTTIAEGRMIQVAYSDIKEYKETMLPGSVVINTFQPKEISN
jgi:septin family protein